MSSTGQLRGSLGRNLTFGMLDALGRQIVTGYYDNRLFPTEAELSLEHAVSRSVTREAVKMLTTKGLLSARPRQGTVVQPSSEWNLFDTDVLSWLLDRRFSLELLRHFTDLRSAIEPAAAALAAQRNEREGFAAIDKGFQRMKAAEQGDDDPLDADIAFHVAILDASGNPFFAQLREAITTALRTSIRFTNRIAGHNADLDAHKRVLEAIRAGRAQAASRAMMKLLADTRILMEPDSSI